MRGQARACAANGCANAAASTSVRPPSATDTRHSTDDRQLRPACADHARRDKRVRRHDLDDACAQAGRREYALALSASAGGVPLSVESFSRHCAYDFGEPVIGDGHLVAGDLTFDVQATVDPPERRMPSGDDADDDLQDVHEIVTPLHVRPLVDQDAIQFVGVERPHERRRDGDHRRSPSEDRRGRHRVGQHERGAPPLATDAAPVRQARFEHAAGTRGCARARDGSRRSPRRT